MYHKIISSFLQSNSIRWIDRAEIMLRKKLYQGLINGREAWLKVRILFPAKVLTQVGKDGMDLSLLREACAQTVEQCLQTVSQWLPVSLTTFLLPAAISNLISSHLNWEFSDVCTEQRNGCYISYFGCADQISLT